MLKGNAYTVGKIIKLFTGKSPLKVMDMEEPFFEMGSEALLVFGNSEPFILLTM